MTTRSLIDQLAVDVATLPAPVSHTLTRWSLGAGGLAVVAFAATLGMRDGWTTAVQHPLVAAKTLIPLALALGALAWAHRSALPAAPSGTGRTVAFAAGLVALALVIAAFLSPPAIGLSMAFMGKSLEACLTSIVALSVPVLGGTLMALRRGAPTHPTWSGALAGLAAGGLAAALYSLHCTEDSPLFYVPWYGVGIAMASVAGALIGRFALRW